MPGKDPEVDWLEGIHFSRNKGEIQIHGQRHVVVNANVFRAYRDAISEIIGHGANAVLYLAGKRHTEKYINNLLRKSSLANLVRKFRWGQNKIVFKAIKILDDYGYGRTEIEHLDLDGKSSVRIYNSCIATRYTKKQKGPTCSYIAGLLAGGAEAIAKKDYIVQETHCRATGNKYCRFEMKRE